LILFLCRGAAQAQPTTPAASAQVPAAEAVVAPPPDTVPGEFQPWTGGRYRITASDVIELKFPYVPEFDQVVTVQPDGYVTLRAVGEMHAQARTVPELRLALIEAYSSIMREPVITVTLKEFEKPYFVAAGEVKTPGKFELRGATTVTQALALAGGLSPNAKHSQVILFRRYSDDLLEVKEINVKEMFASRDLSEDYILRPGDTLFVPRNLISRLKPFLPTAGLGMYLNPFSR
jgi:polysaccharide export outer membrane protein